ncbi:MAG: sigma-70 family RNA polymerase sigma factor, partial [Bacilli bacterium]|nr:sigma-70 family RNA polymerase sigma factor [Bacilli bacterium]
MRLYLAEIRRIPPLTKEEEKELFEQLSLMRQLKKSSQAEKIINRIAEANLRLVISVAKKYVTTGIPLLDLIQDGNEGLLKAISKYDLQKKTSLTTYAMWWIRQYIIAGVDTLKKSIHIPAYKKDEINGILRARSELEQQLHRSVTAEDLATVLPLSTETIRKDLEYLYDELSLYTPTREDGDYETLMNITEDKNAVDPVDEVERKILIKKMQESIAQLSEKEAFTIRMRFGIQNNNAPNPLFDNPHTLKEIAAIEKVEIETIRQRIVRIIRKLNNDPTVSDLKESIS